MNKKLHIERNFFILFFVFFFIIFIPGLSDRTRLYTGIFIFGLMMGEIMAAMFFGLKEIVTEIKNIFTSPYKGHWSLKIIVLIVFVLVAAFFIYLIYFYNKYGATLLSPVAIPWWFILVGIAVDFLFYIFKRWFKKRQ